MSLVPLDSLLVILESVIRDRGTAGDRLSLAILMSDLLSYYDSRRLADAVTVSEGILLTIDTFPDDTESALVWQLEASHLPLSENLMESSPRSLGQLERCLG